MPYRVSLESGVDEAIEEVDCEDWAAVRNGSSQTIPDFVLRSS